jgi:predicted aspartyl protease
MNSRDVLQAYEENGLRCPEPIRMKALLDTGASVTIISKTFANHCKLLQTNEGSELTAVGSKISCGEHAGAISFPNTDLKSFDSIRIRSVDFYKQPNYAILIGRDILRKWKITFDGPSKRVTITD